MKKAKFWVEDLFSLVDVGVAVAGAVIEGEVDPSMQLVLGDKRWDILRIEGMEDKVFDKLDVQLCKSLSQAPGVIIENVEKKELNDLGIHRGVVVDFEEKK